MVVLISIKNRHQSILGWTPSNVVMKKLISTILVAVAVLPCLHSGRLFAADGSTNRPFLAIWRDSDGNRLRSGAPYLRIAIWNDGRVVFAKNTNDWNHDMLEGRIEPARVEELKKALKGTGVFELKGYCYLVPDAPVDCIMVDLGDRKQMLYWDEREMPGYGININPKPHHLEFMRCWKEVNKLALEAIPTESSTHPGRFERPPQSWRPKEPIQSE